ncbi:HAD family hydrolase [Halobacterium litoreum]|uniref:HAD family hydrolase n=1 Tax=Halobacterium litoreum TaxID=2039234 RepID=A0ABD5NHZ9_9EURY|nr:HAD family hydrolase [Halobacterium litoreum]UHH12292.1 HAD family hydrolase [Halobacterium litoreum]
MTYEAVFFDLDDTLYSYPECNEAGKQAAWEEAVELGYDSSREDFEDLYMEARREVKRELAGTASAHERFLYFKRAIQIQTGTHSARHALALGEAYWDAYVDEMELFDGVIETLETLQDAGLDVAIVTNLTTRIQMKKIEHLGIEEHLDLVLTSEETGREKPSSVMFTLPMAQLNVRPSEVAMVGDSVSADVEGGNALGLTTVLFNNDADGLEGRERPDHQIQEFANVREVVL